MSTQTTQMTAEANGLRVHVSVELLSAEVIAAVDPAWLRKAVDTSAYNLRAQLYRLEPSTEPNDREHEWTTVGRGEVCVVCGESRGFQ